MSYNTIFTLALMIIFTIILCIIVYIYFLSLINTFYYKVPQVASFNSDLKVMRAWLQKYNLAWKKLIDMWSWSWKILRFFEKEFGCFTTWYEVDLKNVLTAKFLAYIFSSKSLTIKQNYFNANLWDYEIIYIYLYPELVAQIEEKINKEAKKGTIVIANAFKLTKATPKEILYSNKWKEEVYIYEV